MLIIDSNLNKMYSLFNKLKSKCLTILPASLCIVTRYAYFLVHMYRN